MSGGSAWRYLEILGQNAGELLYVGGGVAGLLVGWGICGGVIWGVVWMASAVEDWSTKGAKGREEERGANEQTASEGSRDS
ncbi:MAG: hypothetical protein OEU26_34145 [Candidatus Tectomicrobia bacterium]|nr:hypothetical protein [Candidatus Tectomicrobia bacterium]